MILHQIYSNRFAYVDISYHLVYEWEDDLSFFLNLPVKNPILLKCANNNLAVKSLSRVACFEPFFSKYTRLFGANRNFLSFEMYPKSQYSYTASSNSIPVIIDFWKDVDVKQFELVYKRCKAILISSTEVMEYLQSAGCTLNLVHFPLSISDRYKISNTYYPKQYDIIIAGRTNPVLWSFIQEYATTNPQVEYLYRTQVDGTFLYVSNKRGIIGNFNTRADYMQLVKSCKIAFYSTPGIDGGEQRTGGFNPVTPRLFEFIASQCLILGRYADNSESRYYNLAKVCPNVSDFSTFSRLLDQYLSQSHLPIDVYQEFLDHHYTSVRAKQLSELLSRI